MESTIIKRFKERVDSASQEADLENKSKEIASAVQDILVPGIEPELFKNLLKFLAERTNGHNIDHIDHTLQEARDIYHRNKTANSK